MAGVQKTSSGSIDCSMLKDIREIKIDIDNAPLDRIAAYLNDVQTPDIIRVGDTIVELGWADTDKTIQDCMADLFRSMA